MSDKPEDIQDTPELFFLLSKPTPEEIGKGANGLVWYENGKPTYKVSLVYKGQYIPALIQQNSGMVWGDDGTEGQTYNNIDIHAELLQIESDIKSLEIERKIHTENRDWQNVEIVDAKLRLCKTRHEKLNKKIEEQKKDIN